MQRPVQWLEARLGLREARINRWEQAEGLADLGHARLNAGQPIQGTACLAEALAIYRIYGSKQRIERTIKALMLAETDSR